MSSEPDPAWVGFVSEAHRLSQLATGRILKALPVFTFASAGPELGSDVQATYTVTESSRAREYIASIMSC